MADLARTLKAVERRYRTAFPDGAGVPFALRLADGTEHVFGEGRPEFTLQLNTARGIAAMRSLDRLRLCQAYLNGDIDVEGDLLVLVAIRNFFPDRHPLLSAGRFLAPLLFGQVSRDKRWVAEHYDHEQDFYLLFLDRRHRCYSHGIYERDDEPIEDAMTRKLDFAIAATGLKSGDHVLDIGGGWGAFVEHAGRRGIRVTSLTISRASEGFLRELIETQELPCEVRLEHLFEHRPAERYDAIVNLGVTEHLPDYRRTLAVYQSLIKPGGRIYLDAGAARKKFDVSTFMYRHVYAGNVSLLVLHDYLAQLARTPLQLRAVYDDRHSYELTARHWAERLELHREEIERRWGRRLFRSFQLYLWGVAGAFQRDMMQAYRLVLEMPAAPSDPVRS